jgi:molybdopterin-containing oxidoreductase family membrane subunit
MPSQPPASSSSGPTRAAADPPLKYIPAGHDFSSITTKISELVLGRPTQRTWLAFFMIGTLLSLIFLGVVVYLLMKGVGIWGINVPVGWCFAITSFVWWIGIGHAGTAISAILLLMHQKWRTPINRIAEAMTIFAVMCAGVFPLLHLGRPWFFYWLLPYPNTMSLWPQFRSALVWDVFAVSTYFTVSLLFWYLGMIPDLATLRDRALKRRWQIFYGFLALGWRNSAKHWHRYESAYLILGGLATPLVVSVHSVVSSDFAISIEPAWHETVFPPYFVAGALHSGFAMVLALCIPLRHYYRVQDFITIDHLQVMAKILLATSFFTSYGYFSEQFITWISGETYDRYVYWNILFGFDQYAVITWCVLVCVTLAPQLLWIPALRRNEKMLFIISILVLAGMWMERYLLISATLSRDFLPSSWGIFKPTIFDILIYTSSIGIFIVAFLLFCRFLPIISMSEMRALLPGAHGHEEGR